MQFKRLFFTITFLLNLLLTSFAQEPTLLEHGGGVRTVEFSPVDASLLASAGEDGTIKLWNLRNNTAMLLRGHTGRVNSVAFSPDGALLASVSDDRTIRLWNVQNQQNVETLQNITDRYQSIVFSPDGQLLATAGGRHVKLWNVRNRTEIATLQHNQDVRTVAFSHDSQLLAVGDGSGDGPGTVKVWNVQRRQVVTTLDGDPKSIKTVTFSPDDRYLASSGWDGQLKVWDVSTWTLFRTIPHTGYYDIAFSPDGKTLVSTNGGVVFWSVETGEKITSLPAPEGWIHPLDFSSDGTNLAVGGDDGGIRIYSVGELLQAEQQGEIVRLIYFRPRDRRHRPDRVTALRKLIKDVQQFYANEMERHGFGRKTFTVETDADGELLVHHVDGKFTDAHYQIHTPDKVWKEIKEQFYISKHVYLCAIDISTEVIGTSNIRNPEGESCGDGSTVWHGGGRELLIPVSGHCFERDNGMFLTAHELGHGFGLEHDFRNDAFIMSYGGKLQYLSQCAAEFLEVHRCFNPHSLSSNGGVSFGRSTTVRMHAPRAARPADIRLRFEVNDPDGLHQAQLFIPTTATDPAPYLKLHGCQSLNGESYTIEFVTSELPQSEETEIMLGVIDKYGSITQHVYRLKIDHLLPSPKVVSIPDARLAARVRKTLEIAPRKPITNLSLLRLTQLDADRHQITNLAGLQHAVNLRRLSLNRNRIRDLTPFTKLTHLTRLSLQDNQIRNVRPLAGLVTLTTLRLAGNPIQDMAPLQTLLERNPDLQLDIVNIVNPLAKITGPWLWMIAPTKVGQGGANSTNVDSLAAASRGAVTEAKIARRGAKAGDTVGKYAWTLGEIDMSGSNNDREGLSNNVNDLINRIGLVDGRNPATTADDRDIDHHSSYALIMLKSARVRSGVTMRVGSDDSIKVWLNGEVVYTKPVNRGAGDFQDQFQVNLKQGDNLLLVKVSENEGYWSMFVGIDADVKTKQPSADPAAAPMLSASEILLPTETVLLSNYPNPFNPETWIPYQLAEPAAVTLTIYTVNGGVVRWLSLGYQPAGIHQSRSRAAYWDGRNETGEVVASGIYFYTLSAGDFNSTRKMFIRK